MATLAAAPVSYSAYINGLIEQANNREFKHMRRAALALLHQEFGMTDCFWSDEWCDCHDVATVHDIESEQDLCSRHHAALLKARR